jgi:pantoate--beta-alanine ligase
MDLNLVSLPTSNDAAVRMLRAKAQLRSALERPRHEGLRIGLVPTMGYLHEGHVSLLRAARAESDLVVMSLFVNPTQFGPGEDLDRYPRDEQRDLRLAAEAGVDLRLCATRSRRSTRRASPPRSRSAARSPRCSTATPRAAAPATSAASLPSSPSCSTRSGPRFAYFGQKDAQQAAVIRRMIRDLDFPVWIVVLPTVREPDGLAMSSRNAYLEPADGERAVALSRALSGVRDAGLRGRPLAAALAAGEAELAAARIEPEYLEARDAETLATVTELGSRPVLVAVAASDGAARLIDNVLIDPWAPVGPSPNS